MQVNKYISKIILLNIIILFSACGAKVDKYIDKDAQLYKKRFELQNFKNLRTKPKYHTFTEYKKKTKHIKFKGYNINYKIAKPLFERNWYTGYEVTGIAKRPYLKRIGVWSGKTHPDKYEYIYSTLHKQAYWSGEKKDYLLVNSLYNKSNKIIDNYINFKCILNDEKQAFYNKHNLIKDCYAKRLQKDIYFYAVFRYPNTKEDKELFKNNIIPTMLKSIKLEETEISPWVLY